MPINEWSLEQLDKNAEQSRIRLQIVVELHIGTFMQKNLTEVILRNK
jgi:hypothetical protein